MEEDASNGLFREDLYFRLNTVMLKIPPLRERRDDIVILYTHYLDQFSTVYDVGAPKLSSSDIASLMTHEWPGNVRELRNVCERHILATRRAPCSVHDALQNNRQAVSTPETLREALAVFERELIGRALVTFDGRMDEVADTLGIGRRTLNEKIVKLGLDKESLLKD